jgi:hypothetical protein
MAQGRLHMKANAAVRYGMVHLLSGSLPLYVVNEFPKSGGTWLSQMLSAALEVPFPRNRFPVLRTSIMQGHYLSPWGMRNVVVVWRDGRDVMVSWYHHCLFRNERQNGYLVQEVRKDLAFQDYEDVRANLPTFIEYAFTRQRHPRFSWAQFVRRWARREHVVYTRYEDLRQDTAAELGRICLELTGKPLDPERAGAVAEEFSFSRQSGRRPGQENKNSFMRKGVVGDWRSHFRREAREAFHHYAGRELVELGYERDGAWAREEG